MFELSRHSDNAADDGSSLQYSRRQLFYPKREKQSIETNLREDKFHNASKRTLLFLYFCLVAASILGQFQPGNKVRTSQNIEITVIISLIPRYGKQ